MMNRIDCKRKQSTQPGFSIVEVLVVVAVASVLLAFGFVGVTRARASMRLSGAAREYASYIERVRIHSVRRHADTLEQAASVAIKEDRTSYVVTLDFDGTMGTRTIQLPDGVTFQTVETIAFDWRGRTWNTVGGVTSSRAQVSITLSNGTESMSVDVTGSGDVTINSRVFDDAVPNVSLKVGDLSSVASASPTPTAAPSPSVSPTPGAIPSPSPVLSPTPLLESAPTPIPIVEPAPLLDQTSTPTPTPTPTPHQLRHQHQLQIR